MEITNKLWKAGINAEYLYKSKANIRKQFDAAEKAGAKLAVILGKEEYPQGQLRIKVLGQGEENEGELVTKDELLAAVQAKLSSDIDDISRIIKGL